jgi:hypothetical protein
MNGVLRLLGVQLLSRLAQRLPGLGAWWASLLVLVVVNLLPVLGVLAGRVGVGDVFLVYWVENVVVYLTGIVRASTAEGGEPEPDVSWPNTYAGFFTIHYGCFTLAHGLVVLFLVREAGLETGLVPVLVLSAAIVAGQLVELGLVWFGRGQRRLVSAQQAMWAPYPRMFVMHAAVIAAFVFLDNGADDGGLAGEDGGVVILCVLKLLIDVGFHLRRWPRRAALDDGLYGAPTG